MVPIKFASLVLGLLLVLQVVRVSLTQAHQARAMNGNGLVMTGEDGLLVHEELLNGKPNAAARTTGLGGRKMTVGRGVWRKGIDDVDGANQENPEISGKHSYAWKKFVMRKSRYLLNDQENLKMPKTWKCSSWGCTSKSKIPSVSQEPPDTAEREEAERLLRAVNELVYLIHKDYTGRDKPKHKPPINNHEPSD